MLLHFMGNSDDNKEFIKFWDFCPFLARGRSKKAKKSTFRFWAPKTGQKPKILKSLKIKFEKPKKMKQLLQKWDFLGHQVKIRSTFGNSRMHWIETKLTILIFCMITQNYNDTNRWNFQLDCINTFYKIKKSLGAPCTYLCHISGCRSDIKKKAEI